MKKRTAKDGLVADFFHDGSGQPRKAVILLGGSEGGKRWSAWPLAIVTTRLVERGYNVLSLAYFKANGLPGSLEEIPLEYFEKTFEWLAAQPEVVSNKYALIGGSKGGELSLLLGSMFANIKAVVGLLPSSVVWQGIPRSILATGKQPRSSWSYRGAGLPYLPSSLSSRDILAMLSMRMRNIMEKDLAEVVWHPEAVIPVERTEGAILLVSGKKDRIWPSTAMSNQIVNRLEEKGFQNYYQHIVFESGHSSVLWNRTCWRTVFSFLNDNFM